MRHPVGLALPGPARHTLRPAIPCLSPLPDRRARLRPAPRARHHPRPDGCASGSPECTTAPLHEHAQRCLSAWPRQHVPPASAPARHHPRPDGCASGSPKHHRSLPRARPALRRHTGRASTCLSPAPPLGTIPVPTATHAAAPMHHRSLSRARPLLPQPHPTPARASAQRRPTWTTPTKVAHASVQRPPLGTIPVPTATQAAAPNAPPLPATSTLAAASAPRRASTSPRPASAHVDYVPPRPSPQPRSSRAVGRSG